MRHSHPPHRALPIAAAAILFACVAQPAEAQLGGLRRAVERRVEQKAGQTADDKMTAATLIPPTFDATTVELTAPLLDRYIAAMEKQRAAKASNRQRYDVLQAESNTLRESAERAQNPKERQAYEAATTRYDECREGVVNAMTADYERQTQAMTQRMMSDPVAAQRDPKMKEVTAAITAMTTAQQSGDSAAVRRATQRMASVFGLSVDSAAIDRRAAPKCGARPVKPRSMVLADSLGAAADRKVTEANALLSSSGGVSGADVGLTNVQARMVWERIQSWLNGVQDSAPITRTFSRPEYDLLIARRGALKKAFANSE